MGKDLKGKELGKGICQRKDGLYSARRNYAERYHYNVGPYIGDIYLTELKPMHCKQVLNQMEPQYATCFTIGEGSFTGCLVGCAKFTTTYMRRK